MARLTPDRVIIVHCHDCVLGQDILLFRKYFCPWATVVFGGAWPVDAHYHCRLFTLTVPLSTQVYKWVLANLMLGGVALRWTNIPSRGERK